MAMDRALVVARSAAVQRKGRRCNCFDGNIDANPMVVVVPWKDDGSKRFRVNYAGLLGLVAATAFTLPLLTQFGEYAGLPRLLSIALSLLLAVVAAAWLLGAVYRTQRALQLPPSERKTASGGNSSSSEQAPGGSTAVSAVTLLAPAPPSVAAATIDIDVKEESNASV